MYENLGLLGKGKYAEVYKGKRKEDGRLIAIKNIKVNRRLFPSSFRFPFWLIDQSFSFDKPGI